MPTYRYRCDAAHEFQVWRSIHEDTVRELPCEECTRSAVMVLASPAIAADALPNKMHGVRAKNAEERRWDKDMPAYKRLRKEGLQPKSIDGAYEAETNAKDPLEVAIGRPVAEKHLSEVKEAHAQMLQNDPAKKGAEIGEALRGGKEVPV